MRMHRLPDCNDHDQSRPWSHEHRRLLLGLLVWAALLCTALWPQTGYGQPMGTDPALQQLLAARNELHDAERALAELTQKHKAKLEASDPEWARLCRAARDANAERDRTRDAVMVAAKDKPEYRAAMETMAKAEERMRKLTDAHNSAGNEFKDADERAYAMRNRIRELEATALRDSVELKSAEEGAAEARQSMDAYWQRYASEVLARNPSWKQALRRRDEAAETAQQAETAFAAARRQVASTAGYGSRQGSYRSSSRSGSSSRSSGSSRSGSSSRSSRSGYR